MFASLDGEFKKVSTNLNEIRSSGWKWYPILERTVVVTSQRPLGGWKHIIFVGNVCMVVFAFLKASPLLHQGVQTWEGIFQHIGCWTFQTWDWEFDNDRWCTLGFLGVLRFCEVPSLLAMVSGNLEMNIQSYEKWGSPVVHSSTFVVVPPACLPSSIQYANIFSIFFYPCNNVLWIFNTALGGFHFAAVGDALEWLDMSTVTRLMPTIGFR